MNVPCEKIRESLPGYIMHELPTEQAWLVREHLRNCPECAKEADELAKTLDFLAKAARDDGEATLRPSARKRLARAILHPVIDWICVHHRLVAWTVAIAAFAAVLAVAWIFRFKPEIKIYWLK